MKRAAKSAPVTCDSFLGQFATVEAGDRIKLDYGCMYGSEFATVTGKGESRWGQFVTCEKEDGSAHTVHGFTTVGIGAYYLGRGATVAASVTAH